MEEDDQLKSVERQLAVASERTRRDQQAISTFEDEGASLRATIQDLEHQKTQALQERDRAVRQLNSNGDHVNKIEAENARLSRELEHVNGAIRQHQRKLDEEVHRAVKRKAEVVRLCALVSSQEEELMRLQNTVSLSSAATSTPPQQDEQLAPEVTQQLQGLMSEVSSLGERLRESEEKCARLQSERGEETVAEPAEPVEIAEPKTKKKRRNRYNKRRAAAAAAAEHEGDAGADGDAGEDADQEAGPATGVAAEGDAGADGDVGEDADQEAGAATGVAAEGDAGADGDAREDADQEAGAVRLLPRLRPLLRLLLLPPLSLALLLGLRLLWRLRPLLRLLLPPPLSLPLLPGLRLLWRLRPLLRLLLPPPLSLPLLPGLRLLWRLRPLLRLLLPPPLSLPLLPGQQDAGADGNVGEDAETAAETQAAAATEGESLQPTANQSHPTVDQGTQTQPKHASPAIQPVATADEGLQPPPEVASQAVKPVETMEQSTQTQPQIAPEAIQPLGPVPTIPLGRSSRLSNMAIAMIVLLASVCLLAIGWSAWTTILAVRERQMWTTCNDVSRRAAIWLMDGESGETRIGWPWEERLLKLDSIPVNRFMVRRARYGAM